LEQVTSQPADGRVPALDGLRAIAILMVLVNHLFIPKATGGVSTALHVVLSPTWLGVDLFFVLSGYLITGILLRSRDAPHYFLSFYLRRALRIFPAYYAVLALVLAALLVAQEPGAKTVSGLAAGMFFTYVQNWWPVWLGSAGFLINADPLWSYAAHFWSLGIEEQFYLLWPALLYLLPRQQVANSLAGLYLLVLTSKLALWLSGADAMLLFYGTSSRCDALILGAWVAAREYENRPIAAVTHAWIGWVLAAFAVVIHSYYVHLWPKSYWQRLFDEAVPLTAVAALCFAWTLARIRHGSGGTFSCRLLCNTWMAWLSRLSYSLYLVHLPIQHLLTPPLTTVFQIQGLSVNTAHLLAGLVILPICIGAAMLLYHGLEMPILGRRSQIEARLLRR